MGCGEGGGTLPSAPLRGAWGRRSLALDASATTVNFTPSGAEVAMELMSQRMSRSRSEHTRPRFGPAGAWICMHAAADVRRAGWSAAQGLAVARRAAQQVAERQKEWEGAFGRRGAGVGAMWCGGDVAWGRCGVGAAAALGWNIARVVLAFVLYRPACMEGNYCSSPRARELST